MPRKNASYAGLTKAWEVYSIPKIGGYWNRVVYGVFFSAEEAEAFIAQRRRAGLLPHGNASIIWLSQISGQWRRVLVEPINVLTFQLPPPEQGISASS